MQVSVRLVFCAVVLLFGTGAFVSCSDDETSGGEDPPRTVDDVAEVTATAATSIAVLGNDTELDNEPLTFSIDEQPTVGSASFNSDNTVRLTLPSGFRGVTRFRYKITNSLGGFSISSAAVFVDVPAYRVLFAALNSSQNYELYLTDLNTPVQISRAVSSNLRLQNAWRSENGGLIVYERADPALTASTAELFYVDTTPVADPVRVPQPGGRNFISGGRVVISPDDRYIAFPATSTSGGGQAASLYVFDTTSTNNSATSVGLSTNLATSLTEWGGDQSAALYYLAAPGNVPGFAVYRAQVGSFDSPQRVSPFYASADTNGLIRVSPDQSQIVLLGTHAGQNGAFLIDPTIPNDEERLTTDMPAGAVIESFEIDEAFTQLTYLWRPASGATARLSVVDISATSTPRTVLNATDIASFTGLRPDGAAALVTRGTGGPGSDGTLFEVPLDGSTTGTRIAFNETGGLYDDTGDNVFLYSRTRTPSVISRSNFDRDDTPLVRTSTNALALYVTPFSERSAAIIEDSTSGLVLVNATSPGNTLRLTTLSVGSVPATLLPDIITAR